MMKDENWYELVQGDHSRSGGQWDIWEATYGPVGADGYPQRDLGQDDRRDRQGRSPTYWKEHYDLRNILETNWATLGPKLANKINVYVGDADSYFLNMGVHMLDEFLKKADNPKWTGEIVFQPMAPHCWGPPRTELIAEDVGADREVRPGGRGRDELEILMNTRRQFLIKAPLGFLVATVDVTLDGGAAGSATLSSASVEFSSALSSVPEPSAGLLAALWALSFLCLARPRQKIAGEHQCPDSMGFSLLPLAWFAPPGRRVTHR